MRFGYSGVFSQSTRRAGVDLNPIVDKIEHAIQRIANGSSQIIDPGAGPSSSAQASTKSALGRKQSVQNVGVQKLFNAANIAASGVEKAAKNAASGVENAAKNVASGVEKVGKKLKIDKLIDARILGAALKKENEGQLEKLFQSLLDGLIATFSEVHIDLANLEAYAETRLIQLRRLFGGVEEDQMVANLGKSWYEQTRLVTLGQRYTPLLGEKLCIPEPFLELLFDSTEDKRVQASSRMAERQKIHQALVDMIDHSPWMKSNTHEPGEQVPDATNRIMRRGSETFLDLKSKFGGESSGKKSHGTLPKFDYKLKQLLKLAQLSTKTMIEIGLFQSKRVARLVREIALFSAEEQTVDASGHIGHLDCVIGILKVRYVTLVSVICSPCCFCFPTHCLCMQDCARDHWSDQPEHDEDDAEEELFPTNPCCTSTQSKDADEQAAAPQRSNCVVLLETLAKVRYLWLRETWCKYVMT